jgi:MFS family permease
MIFTIVNVCSTPISFYTVERFGRRPLLIYGALGMLICQFLVAIIGVTVGFNKLTTDAAGDPVAQNIGAVNAQVAFIAIFIFFFASTWGPGAWVLIGEIYPLPIRSRGVALSTASNWVSRTPVASNWPVADSHFADSCGTLSSLSSHPTWLVRIRVTFARLSSSSGE